MSLTSYRAAPPRVNYPRKRLPTKIPVLPTEKAALEAGRGTRPVPPFRRACAKRRFQRAFCRPGSDLLSRVLRRSTISAGAFHGRVRNGIGCSRSAITTRSAKRTLCSRSCFCAVSNACRLPDEVRKADRPSALMRRSREAPPEGRNKRERWFDEHKE